MDIIYRLGSASVAEIMVRLPAAPTSGAVRRMLNLLYAKGAVEYKYQGPKKVYRSVLKKEKAGEKALDHVIETFFGGSVVSTAAALFNQDTIDLSTEEKKLLTELIEKAKKQGD